MPPGISDPPARVIEVSVLVTVPPHWLEAGAVTLVIPAGKVSVNANPEREANGLVLVSVIVNRVVCPTAIGFGENALATVGARIRYTVTLSVGDVTTAPPEAASIAVANAVLVTSPFVRSAATTVYRLASDNWQVITPPGGRTVAVPQVKGVPLLILLSETWKGA